MKTVLIHTPKFNNFYKPKGDYTDINQISMGLFALCDFIARNDFQIEIIHLGIEYYLNRNYTVCDTLDSQETDVVGLGLHWHQQSFDVIEIAKKIKERYPHIFLFLGGFTASFFAEQILKDFPEVDAVIRGDAEVPLLHLLQALNIRSGMDRVENLCWRDGGEVRNNGIQYNADSEILTSLNYANFAFLNQYRKYIKSVSIPFSHKKNLSIEENARRFTIGGPIFNLPLGRGCDYTCSWCGGSSQSLRMSHCQRQKYTQVDQARVLRTIADALSFGFKTIMSSFDPYVGNEQFFLELWARMRSQGFKTAWIFEANGLPSETLIREFKKNFPDDDSFITLSPVHGNEAIRRWHKGPFFTTQDLLTKLRFIEAADVAFELFYIIGLPGENEKNVHDTIGLTETIRENFKNVRGQRVFNVELDPGSPMQVNPQKYGIVTSLKTFKDYYHYHGLSSQKFPGEGETLGYYANTYFGKKLDPARPYSDFADRIAAIRCKYFCSLHIDPKKSSNPRDGRQLCGEVSKRVPTERDLSRPF